VWGIEYDGDGSWEMNGKRYHDVACSVCQVKEPANTFVHWGGWKCPAVSKKHSGLTDRTKGGDEVVEYQGWVAAEKWNRKSTEFVCVDASRDVHYGQRSGGNDAGRIYPTFFPNNARHSIDENIYKNRQDWLYCSVCKSQDCPAGHFAAKFADECKACKACGAGEYEDPDTRCTTHSDRKCLKCSTGESGYFMSTPCSDAHGAGEWSKCSPECGDGFYEFVGCNADHDRQCEPIQDCAPGTFEVLPPTSSSDRQCEKGRVACDRTKEYEIAPATATSGAVCFDFTVGCAKGEYMTEPTPAGKTCHAYTVVCASDEYESKAATDSSDRECKPVSGMCDKGTEFEFSAPTRTRDRDCEPLQICGQGQYESAAPREHSTKLYNIKDRSCKVLEECAADEYEVITEAGPSCANICHMCEPGTYAKLSCQVGTKTLAKRQTECATCTTCGKHETMIEGCTHDHDRVCACTYGSGPTGNCYSSPQGSVRSNSAKVLSSVGDIAMTGESVEIIVDAGRTNVLPAFNLKDELQKTQAQAEEAGAEMDCSIANCE
jgi:hypothetical protein